MLEPAPVAGSRIRPRPPVAALVSALGLLLVHGTAHAAVTLAQTIGTASLASAGTSISVTVPGGVAAGDTILLAFAMRDTGAGIAATDSRGNVYTLAVEADDAGLVRTAILSAPVTTALAAGDTITVTHPATTARALAAADFAGIAAPAPLDRTAIGSGIGTTPATGPTAVTGHADELVLGAIGTDGPASDTLTPGVGYAPLTSAGTATGSDVSIFPEFQVTSTTGSYAATGTLSTSRDWAAAVATFVAASSAATTTTTVPGPVCGNGIVEAGEQCDAGAANGTAASCCTLGCTFQPADTSCADDGNPCTRDLCDGTDAVCQHPPGNAGVLCRPATGPCDLAGLCTGASATCPADTYAPATTLCRAGGSCALATYCSGTGPTCPPLVLLPAGTVCRPAAGPCDVPETCDGASTQCPPDLKQPAGTVCRPAAGPCDVPELCDGATNACPPDAVAPAGTPCGVAPSACGAAPRCDGTGVSCPSSPMGAFCPCAASSPSPARIAKLRLKGLNQLGRVNRVAFAGYLLPVHCEPHCPHLPPTAFDPVAHGIRFLVNGANGSGNLLDVTIPGGTGWRVDVLGNQWEYRNPGGAQGIIKVLLRNNNETPGFMVFRVVGKGVTLNGGFPFAPAEYGPSPLPLSVMLVLAPPDGISLLPGDPYTCGEATYPGPPSRSCTRINLDEILCQ